MKTTSRLAAVLVAAAASVGSLGLAPSDAAAAPVPASPRPTAAPKPFTPARATVLSALSVRSKPTTASARLATLRKGTDVAPFCSAAGQSVGGNRTWYWASDYEIAGWVSAKYVKVRGSVPKCSSFPGLKLMNVTINSPAQVAKKLSGTSASFRSFMVGEARELLPYVADCRAAIHVIGWWNADQAIGYVDECGGYAAVWTRVNGRWRETGWNGDVLCDDLRRAGARHAIPGNTRITCFVKSGSTWVEQQYTPKR